MFFFFFFKKKKVVCCVCLLYLSFSVKLEYCRHHLLALKYRVPYNSENKEPEVSVQMFIKRV